MAVSALAYGNFLLKALNKEIDFDSDTIKVMLCTSSYSPNQDTHIYKSSVTNEVANGNGYTTGGWTMTNKSITYDGSTNTIKLTSDNPTWANSSITARYAVIYDDSPATDATKPLIGYVNFGADFTSNAGSFTITWAAAGMLTVVAS